jgi:hypothetical protein
MFHLMRLAAGRELGERFCPYAEKSSQLSE